MKINISTFKSILVAFFFIFLISTFFSFSKGAESKSETIKSYMSIFVEYEHDHQFITISQDTSLIRIAVLETPSSWLIRQYEKSGFKVLTKTDVLLYDNREVLEIINEYTAKNWTLHSQSIGVGIGVADESASESSRTVSYLLEK